MVPCYNYGRYLEWCVGTLLSQAGVQVRVLIIDDASSDNTPEIGRRLAAADGRVEFRRHETNAGHIATYNEGLLHWASAEYSLLISADDGLAPGALARATHRLSEHPDVGLTYGMATIITDDHPPEPRSATDPDDYRIVTVSQFLERCCRVGNPVPSPVAVVRTGVQQQLGGYRADLPHSGDMEMWMRFALHGPVGVLRSTQGFYRWHGTNMSSGYYGRLISDRRERVQAFAPLEPRLAAAVPEFPAWYAAMCERLGIEALEMAHAAFESGDSRGYAECVAFAVEVFPAMRRSIAWKKLRVKQWMGRRALRGLRTVVNRIRGEQSAAAPSRAGLAFQAGGSTGWWPSGPA